MRPRAVRASASRCRSMPAAQAPIVGVHRHQIEDENHERHLCDGHDESCYETPPPPHHDRQQQEHYKIRNVEDAQPAHGRMLPAEAGLIVARTTIPLQGPKGSNTATLKKTSTALAANHKIKAVLFRTSWLPSSNGTRNSE